MKAPEGIGSRNCPQIFSGCTNIYMLTYVNKYRYLFVSARDLGVWMNKHVGVQEDT